MAPPHKKRRLLASDNAPSPTTPTSPHTQPTPSFAHSVEHLEHNAPPSSPSRPIPHRVQEVHLHVQERSVVAPRDYRHHYQRRQIGTVAVESVITTVDAAGSTILSTVSTFIPTGTLPLTSTSPTTLSDGLIGSGTVGTSTSSSANSSSLTSTASGSLQTNASGTFTSHSEFNFSDATEFGGC